MSTRQLSEPARDVLRSSLEYKEAAERERFRERRMRSERGGWGPRSADLFSLIAMQSPTQPSSRVNEAWVPNSPPPQIYATGPVETDGHRWIDHLIGNSSIYKKGL